MSLITDIRDDCLGLVGIEDASHASPAALARILADINSVGQQLYTPELVKFWAMDDGAANLRGPTTLTGLTVTAGQVGISGGSLASWMDGCCLRLAGEPNQNYIQRTGSSSWELLIPYRGGTSAAETAEIYQNVVNLSDTVIQVERPVILIGCHELKPLTSPAQLRLRYSGRSFYVGQNADWRGADYPVMGWDRDIATPQFYEVLEQRHWQGAIKTRLHVHPLPDRAYDITWRQKLAFSRVDDFSDARAVICPHDYLESVFLPLVRESFSGFPLFTGDKQRIAADAQTARSVLATLAIKQPHQEILIDTTQGW